MEYSSSDRAILAPLPAVGPISPARSRERQAGAQSSQQELSYSRQSPINRDIGRSANWLAFIGRWHYWRSIDGFLARLIKRGRSGRLRDFNRRHSAFLGNSDVHPTNAVRALC